MGGIYQDLVLNRQGEEITHGHFSAHLLRSTVAELADTQSTQSSFPNRPSPPGPLFSTLFFTRGILHYPLLPVSLGEELA